MEDRLIRRFSEMIAMIDRGRFESSLNDAVKECLEAIRAQPDQKGKATMSIEMEIAAQGEMVQIKPKLKIKLPDGQSFAPLVLWDYEGALSTQHPNQFSMFKDEEKVADIRGGMMPAV